MKAGRKNITLCADDFALSAGVSHGIADLLIRERLSATSCMTTSSRWTKDAELLKPLCSRVDIGLHFNLTEGQALTTNPFNHNCRSFSGLGVVMRKTLMRQVSCKSIMVELNAQLDAFADIMGAMPEFIDGHQHIHHLPVIRQALLNVYQQRLKKGQCYIRAVSPLITAPGGMFTRQRLKEYIILSTGGKSMRSLLDSAGIPVNTMFAGIYDFVLVDDFPAMMQYWLARAANGALFMCHPGYVDSTTDALYNSREKELNYLQNDAFKQACDVNNVSIKRLLTEN